MRIAMLAPINWPLPPDGYGPWELVASNLTEALVALGEARHRHQSLARA